MYLDARDGMAVLPDGVVRLTPREVQLLALLIDHQGHWVSQDHISTMLQMSEGGVRIYVNKLRKKLADIPEGRYGYGYMVQGWELAKPAEIR